jgi:hypothetical protein
MTDITERTRINAIELNRTGEGGGWRIALPMSTVTTLPTGRKIVESAATIAHNAAELMHDERFAKTMQMVKEQADRIASGELAPLPPKAEPIPDTTTEPGNTP